MTDKVFLANRIHVDDFGKEMGKMIFDVLREVDKAAQEPWLQSVAKHQSELDKLDEPTQRRLLESSASLVRITFHENALNKLSNLVTTVINKDIEPDNKERVAHFRKIAEECIHVQRVTLTKDEAEAFEKNSTFVPGTNTVQ
jgi:hypothetical protein